tara:strand:+ start:4550 stop:5905 length:1356 start_codon:yes stop_codon:yes gene_type:complete
MAQNAASNLDYGTVQQAMKIHYKSLRVKDMVYKDNPLLAMLPKYESFGGLNMPIPIIYSNPQRAGATFGNAQSITSTSRVEQFIIERKKDYSFASVDGETIKASQGDTNAFLRYLTLEIDGALHTLNRRLAIALYGDGTGRVGVLTGAGLPAGPGAVAPAPTPAIAAQTVTLSSASDITNFEVGMFVQLLDTGAVPQALIARNSGAIPGVLPAVLDAFVITKVDRDLGTIELDDSAPNGVAVVASPTVIPYGDYTAGVGGAASSTKVFGLDAWLPNGGAAARAAALLAPFNGVIRDVDSTRLGGIVFDGTAMPIEEALISAASRAAREGARPDTCFVDFETFSTLEKALGAKVLYTQAKARDVDMGFHAMHVQGPRGLISIVPDQNCPANTAYMLQMDTWSLNSLGSAPHILDLDGSRMLREAAFDAYEVRCGYYANLACNAPGWNVRVAL